MKLHFSFLLMLGFLFTPLCKGQSLQEGESFISVNASDGSVLKGVLRVPFSPSRVPIAILVSGSGPTDKDGNQPQMVNNSLKYLSDALYSTGIASLRFDKRGVGDSNSTVKSEKDLTLATFVTDAQTWVDMIAKDARFDDLTLVGHSEGALISMLVTNDDAKVDKLVLLAGAGRKIGDILKEQLANNVQGEQKDLIFGYIDQLERGELIDDVPTDYYALFRPSVQPFIISIMKYDPVAIIANINKPILIIQGSTDIQVSVQDAELLSKANPRAEKKIIQDMNHVLKNCSSLDKATQISTYTNPNLPINSELGALISNFIKE